MKAVKLAIPVQVRFAKHSGSLTTLEGPVGFNISDAILIGVAGETWPVAREYFDRSYVPVPPTLAGQPGAYMKTAHEVEVVRLGSPIHLSMGERGTLYGKAGDWLVNDGETEQWLVAAEVFDATYRIVSE